MPTRLLFYTVPGTGIEPAHPCERQILSLLRLPIPPSGHNPDCYREGCNITYSILSFQIRFASFIHNLKCKLPPLKNLRMLTIGLIREGKIPPDNRVALTPAQCKWILQNFPVSIKVQQCEIRCFKEQGIHRCWN